MSVKEKHMNNEYDDDDEGENPLLCCCLHCKQLQEVTIIKMYVAVPASSFTICKRRRFWLSNNMPK